MKSSFAIGAAALVCACAGSESASPKVVPLSPDAVRNIDFSYSPDGSHIAYMAPAAGDVPGWQMWVANADMSSPKMLALTNIFTGNVPAWSPDGKLIAQMGNNFGTASAVVVPAAGGTPRRFSQGPGIQLPLQWNADGDRLEYIASNNSNFTAFSVSAKTGVSVPLIPGEKHPHVGNSSPDGKHIAFLVIEGAKSTVWIADSAGKSPKQITTEGFEQSSRNNIQWSPDSKEILYESRRTGTSDLWVVSIADGKQRQLTRDVRNDYGGAWSSDGKWIAFLSDRGRQTDVWVVPTAGGQEIRVTDTPGEETQLAWRPGTHELAFVTVALKSSTWSRSVDDGKEVQITPDSVRATWFSVSPDGKMVNYTIDRGGGIEDLMVVPVSGGAPRALVSGGGYFNQPRWSPDGSKIVFVSDRGGTPDVWVVDAAGGPPRQLDNWPGFEGSAVWSGDGSSILFQSDHNSRIGDAWKVSPAGGEPVRVTNDGTVQQLWSRKGVADIFASTISTGGQFSIARFGAGGKLQPVWEKSNAFMGAISPSGDAITALVEQSDGKSRATIVSLKGAAPRVIGKANEQPYAWSPDGKSMAALISTAGATDLGVMNVVDGSVKRLTTTPESEAGLEWSPDGKSIFFLRRTTVQRIVTTDLTKLLAGQKSDD